MFSYSITFIVWHEVSSVLTQTQSNNQKFIAFTLRYKQDLFFNKTICCNLLLSRTSPLDHMETMLKNSDISKNPNVACFQKERESLWDPFGQMETATAWAEPGSETPAAWEERVPSSTWSISTWSRHPKWIRGIVTQKHLFSATGTKGVGAISVWWGSL